MADDRPVVVAVAEPPHLGVCCDNCNEANFFGTRYQCQVCHNFDLCSKCFAANAEPSGSAHSRYHDMLAIRRARVFMDRPDRMRYAQELDERDALYALRTPQPPSTAVHHSVVRRIDPTAMCANCHMNLFHNTFSTHYKCTVCDNLRLCPACMARNATPATHASGHAMVQILPRNFSEAMAPTILAASARVKRDY